MLADSSTHRLGKTAARQRRSPMEKPSSVPLGPRPIQASTQELAQRLLAAAQAVGIDRLGFCASSPFPEFSEEMQAARQTGRLSGLEPAGLEQADPQALLPGAHSVVVAVLNHRWAVPGVRPGCGRIARFALGEDYHRRLGRRLTFLADLLHEAGFRALVGVDAWPLPERRLAHRAGLGWLGRNQALIVPGLGSFVSIGAILTDAELPWATATLPSLCGNCQRCRDACPGRALDSGEFLEAGRCLSYISQCKTALPPETVAKQGDWIFGCDRCQEVCPHNTGWPEFPPPPGIPEQPEIQAVFESTARSMPESWKSSAALWRGLHLLRRNALLAAWNTDRTLGLALARRALQDPSPLLRQQAAWLLEEKTEQSWG